MLLEITPAYEMLASVRTLFLEYAELLNADLSFQQFEEELAALPGAYALPRGRLYAAFSDGQLAGCAALRPFDETCCEMKRLYVREQFRGEQIGKTLAGHLIADAREMGCEAMLLDTLSSLQSGVRLYKKLGFYEIPPYRHNPLPGALFFRLDL
ncbi:MAG: GNAT family N-acetyltransferase [Oscillospiraceae bacterium]|jgi:ribosomal protein S18 acetylase RimI-like enzyme|nr:GNAT family N-acetyltransferase [Oscillospiraceae bacterium]